MRKWPSKLKAPYSVRPDHVSQALLCSIAPVIFCLMMSLFIDHSKEHAVSKIELCVRYTGSIWNYLHEKGAPVPPQGKWPKGVRLLPSFQGASESIIPDERTSSGKKASEKESEVNNSGYSPCVLLTSAFRVLTSLISTSVDSSTLNHDDTLGF